MNLPAYIDAIQRTGQNLPGILADWAELEDDLRSHYSDSLIELISTHAEARGAFPGSAEQQNLAKAWDRFVSVVVGHAFSIFSLMGVNVLELLTPAFVTHAPYPAASVPRPADTVNCDLEQDRFAA